MTGYIVAVILAALIASMLDDVGSGRSAEYVRGMADRVRMLRSDRPTSDRGAS